MRIHSAASTSTDGGRRARTALFIAVMAIALAADQIVKVGAVNLLAGGRSIAVTAFLDLRLGYNTGVSFGLFSETFRATPLLLASLAVVIVCILGWLALRSRRPIEIAGFGLVAGGALGNIIDRVRIGAVVDYIDLYYGNWHWPTFNFADVFIACGVALLLATSIFGKKTSTSQP